MKDIDKQLGDLCKEHSWRYTRYADYITFYGNINVIFLLKEVYHIVKKKGLKINAKKTRIAKPNTRQIVTGIVVNKKMQIPKYKRKVICQQVYYIKKYGLDSHLSYTKETRKNYLNHLY